MSFIFIWFDSNIFSPKTERKKVDTIVTELKKISLIIVVSTDGKPLKLPLMRGGENLQGVSLIIKSKKLAAIIRAIFNARRKQK